jgi:precorrin-2 dehydrogenase / sirohydrochlorin ferrochelatase
MVSEETKFGCVTTLTVHGRISKVCEKWSLEDLCEMEEKDMEELLRFYKPNTVPTLEEIRLEKEPGVAEFDGSFGWWI